MSDLIMIGLPSRDHRINAAVLELLAKHGLPPDVGLHVSVEGSSLLAWTFNCLLAEAFNLGATHFFLLHDDIRLEPGALGTLYGEMKRLNADAISLVMPLKSVHGLTSTAIGSRDPFEPWRRLTMKEVCRLPETFCIEDCREAGLTPPYDCPLLVNTGALLLNLTSEWAKREADGYRDLHFTINDCIRKENGKWVARCEPEDWGLSAWLHRRGAKVYATRMVKASHWGEAGFDNQEPWGLLEHDEAGAWVRDLDVIQEGDGHGKPTD